MSHLEVFREYIPTAVRGRLQGGTLQSDRKDIEVNEQRSKAVLTDDRARELGDHLQCVKRGTTACGERDIHSVSVPPKRCKKSCCGALYNTDRKCCTIPTKNTTSIELVGTSEGVTTAK